MNSFNVVVALITSDNDYQAEQAAAATEAAARLGAKIQVHYADNDAVTQTKPFGQDNPERRTASPCHHRGAGSTEMIQVARAAVAAGIGWGILNREYTFPNCAGLEMLQSLPVTTAQARQFAVLIKQGNILYIEGPSSGGGVPHFVPRACCPPSLRGCN